MYSYRVLEKHKKGINKISTLKLQHTLNMGH